MLEPQLMTQLERLRFHPRRTPLGFLRGERLSKRKGISIEFADFRPYTTGDDIRHLDWKIYARLDRPIVKTYRDETELIVSLLLDASSSMAFGDPPKWALAQKLTAALGYLALCGGDVVFPAVLAQEDPPRFLLRGKGMFGHLLKWLKGLRPQGRGLAETLDRLSRTDLPQGMVVLLTDGLDPDFPEALGSLCRRGQEVLLLHILSDAEWEPPLKGDLKLLDSETEENLEITATAGALREYRNRLESFCARIDDICRRGGGWVLRVRSNDPVSDIVLRRLRHMGVVGLA